MNRDQFRAILWLRWRLTRNQWMRGSRLGAAMVVAAIAAVAVIAAVCGVGGTLAGALAMKNAPPWVVMFVWDGVVFLVLLFSLIEVLTELQRSESVDLTRLLHLPIRLKQVFVFNYLVSLVSVGTVLQMAVLLGLGIGLTISHGPRFLLALPLAAMFVFMVTAWIYCLRGWLLSLMVNPRRRRAVIMWITLGIILVGQSPQLLHLTRWSGKRASNETPVAAQTEPAKNEAGLNSSDARREDKRRHFEQLLAIVTRVHAWVPLFWLPNGARSLAAGQILPALWGGAGMFVLGWLGLTRSYRATLRFYRAEEKVKAGPTQPAVSCRPARPARNWVDGKVRWLPDDTAAMALAQLRSMTRAPEVRLMLVLGLFVAIFVPGMLFLRGGGARLPEAAGPFMATGVGVMVLFSFIQLMCNQFGCDRDGFRVLVLLPTQRSRLLLGRNLAVLPLAAGIAFVPLMAVSLAAHLSVTAVLATLLQFASAFLLLCVLGNLGSILVPYRIAAGSLKARKQSWQTTLCMLLVHLSFPFLMLPVFVPPALGFGIGRWAGISAGALNLSASVVLAGASAMLYAVTLGPLARLLRRRETDVLRAVTEIRE